MDKRDEQAGPAAEEKKMTTDTKALAELFADLIEYFDQRADADQACGHAAIPNEELRLLERVNNASPDCLALLEENKRLREALALVSNQIARFVSGPGNCIDPAFYFKNVNGYITEALANHTQESDENKTADWRNDVDSYEPSATPKPEGE